MFLREHVPYSTSAVLDSPDVQRDAEIFASRSVEAIDTTNEVLCVLQGEVAVVSPGDGPAGLGSDSATTCHIVAFRRPSTGRTCLAHLDSPHEVTAAISCMLNLMSRVGGVRGGGGGSGGSGGSIRGSNAPSPEDPAEEEPLDLYVVGGYLGKSCAEELSSGLFSALHESRRPFRVVLACMARLNSVPTRGSAKSPAGERRDQPPAAAEGELRQRGAVSEDPRHDDAWLPRQTGLAVDIATGRAYPVRFEGAGRGPGWEARSSRVFAGSRETALTEVYDPQTDSVVVSPFPVYVDTRWLLQMLALPDRQLLAQTSTSPEAEDDRFVDDIRAQFSYMVAQSGPDGRAWLRNVFGGSRGGPLVFPRAGAGAARGAAIGASEACQPACDR